MRSREGISPSVDEATLERYVHLSGSGAFARGACDTYRNVFEGTRTHHESRYRGYGE